MSLVAAAEDGVMLDVGEAEDIVEACLVGGVEVANDGGGIGLRRRLGRGEEQWPRRSAQRDFGLLDNSMIHLKVDVCVEMRAVEIIVLWIGICSK